MFPEEEEDVDDIALDIATCFNNAQLRLQSNLQEEAQYNNISPKLRDTILVLIDVVHLYLALE